jgi:hypothetical protein
MSTVKIRCALGLNLYFFIPQFANVNAPTKLRKLNPSAIDKCAMVFVLPLSIGKLRNVGVLLTSLRHVRCRKGSLCSIYKGAEHSSRLLQVKND